MARPHERVFALILALLFLATSLAAGVAVVVQVRKDNKDRAQVAQLQDAINQAKTAQDSTTTQDTTKTENKTMLQGTKLADFTPVDKIDSLQKIDLVVGTGEEVQPGATITAHYTGAVAKDGTIFQSSYDMGNPIAFSLSGVIKGWTDGVPGMKVGGKRRLLIPAEQAYGANAPAGSGIPANADLVFDIELVKIGQ